MLKIGSVIDGKYKILNIVGRGGMSIVYLAMNEKANKQWAIKEIIKNDYRDLAVERKEIEMMKRLKHPNLPAIVDVIEQKESLLIVMDYIEGRSLEDIVQEYGPQEETLVVKWAKQLCDVLHYLHTQTPPIIYRDMKPSNVMLKPDGNVMLIDFGAAREYKATNLKDTVLLGTKGYAAPEQYRSDGQSDARTDIYSLGVMVFRLLSGTEPVMLCPIREICPNVSVGIEKILLKCTRVAKRERYQSAAQLYDAFSRYWEYDESFQREQKRKLWIFMIPFVLAICFLTSLILFFVLEKVTRENNYQAYLTAAVKSPTQAEALENYKHSIRLNPVREEAYLMLLHNMFLDDGVFTIEESETIRAILISHNADGKTNEQSFQTNEPGYAQFSYELGVTYFYKYEDKSNKKNAKGYFEIAAASESLSKKKKKRAERLLVISDYYNTIGIMDEAGDIFVTYQDFWKDLTLSSVGNLVEEDNVRTALVMYEELVSQMITNTVNFQNAGVKKEEMLLQIEQIENHLKKDFRDLENSIRQVISEEMSVLEGNIKKARKITESVYGKTE